MGSTDNWLEAAQARLIREAGRWTLEVSETVRIDRHVLGSRRRSVVGEDAILKHVHANVRDVAVVRATANLFRACREERSFEMIEGEWYPVASERQSPDEREKAYRAAILEIQQEIRLLAGKEKKLAKVVADLEARVGARQQQPASAAVEPEQQAAPLRVRSILPPGERHPSTAEPVELHAPEPAARAALAAPDLGDEGPRIELPGRLEILTLLKQLFGQDLRPEYAKKPPLELRGRPSGYHACEFVDANGDSRGAVVVDARACAELGGTLLGLPDTAIEEQLSSGELTIDTLEGMSEVGNNLSGIVNKVSPNCHVRSLPLAPADWDRLSWVERTSRACLLSTEKGGALWLLAR